MTGLASQGALAQTLDWLFRKDAAFGKIHQNTSETRKML
jgi:hypothetical protein